MPRPPSHCVAGAAPGRGISTRWQRLRSVASSREGREVTSTSKVRGEGSSSVFNSAFWAFVVIECAGDTIATR